MIADEFCRQIPQTLLRPYVVLNAEIISHNFVARAQELIYFLAHMYYCVH